MSQRWSVFRDEVSVGSGSSVTLLEFITAAQTPATIYEISLDIENATLANSVPTPMPQFVIERSSTAMTGPTALTPQSLAPGQGTPQTTVNGTNTNENFTAYSPLDRKLNRRVPATGSLWLPYPLGREIVIPISTTSFRFRLLNLSSGAIPVAATINVSFEE
jgi:hypothetical protein